MTTPHADLLGKTIIVSTMPYTVIGPAAWPESQYVILQGPIDQIIRHADLLRRSFQLLRNG